MIVRMNYPPTYFYKGIEVKKLMSLKSKTSLITLQILLEIITK